MDKEKLFAAGGGVFLSAAVAAGGFAADKYFNDITNAGVTDCIERFDGADSEACIEQVRDSASSYELVQLAEVLGLMGIGASLGAMVYHTYTTASKE